MIRYISLLLFIGLAFWSCEEVDETPPVVSILSPNTNTTVSEIVTIQVSASDNNSLEKVELYTSDGLIGTSTTDDAVHSFNWNSDVVDNGEYILYAVAYDDAGNNSTSETITVNVYNTITLTLNNQCFLSMAFQFGKDTPEVEDYIDAESSYEIEVEKDYGTCTIQGLVGSNCSEILAWDFNIVIGSSDLSQNLYVSSSYFFLYLTNSSAYTINDFYVNYKTETFLSEIKETYDKYIKNIKVRSICTIEFL